MTDTKITPEQIEIALGALHAAQGVVADEIKNLLQAIKERDERIETLFDAIKHGDEKHRKWLREAIDNHFAGKPVPEPY